MLFVLSPLSTQAADDWYETAGWKFRQKVTIPAEGIVGSHVNFPVFLDLSELDPAFFMKVRPDGGDIRVTLGDGTTEVPREVVFVDAGAETGEIHFLAPELSIDLEDREFFVYFGNADATDYAADASFGQRAVWVNGYVGVFHKQTVGIDAVLNSVEDNPGTLGYVNANASGVPVGPPEITTGVTETDGYMGGALAYDGETGSYVSVPHSELLNVTGTEITMSAWVRPTAVRQNGYVLNKRSGQFGYGMGITNEYDPSQVLPLTDPVPPATCAATPNTNPDDLRNLKGWAIPNGFSTLTGQPNPCAPTSQGSIGFTYHEPVNSAVGAWNYFATVYNGTNVASPYIEYYWNAVVAGTLDYKGPDHDTVENPTHLRPSTADLYFGVLSPPGAGPTSLPFAGALDEIRISSAARSADWIATEYNNQSAPDGFIEPAPIEAGAGVTLQDLIDITPQGGTLELPDDGDPWGLSIAGVYQVDPALQMSNTKNITIVGLGAGITIKQTGVGQRVLAVGTDALCTNAVTLEHVTITGGTMTGGGGGIFVNAGCDLTLRDVLVTDNSATQDGGGISVAGSLTAEGSTVSNNSSVNAGGISFLPGSTGTLTDVDVTGNTATGGGFNGRGGGVRVNANDNPATVAWTGGTISGNQTAAGDAQSGGAGIHIQGNTTGAGAVLELTDVTISTNTSATQGGGIFVGGNVSVTLAGVEVTGNTATTGDGGGLYFGFASIANAGTVDWIAGSLASNTAGGDGGGVSMDGGADRTLTMRRVTVTGNTATGDGAAIHQVAGTADVTENWWGTDDEEDLLDQQASIEAGLVGTVDFAPWCVLDDCAARLAVEIDAPFGSVTSAPAGINATHLAPSTATFAIDHLEGATFTPSVAGGTRAVALTLDPGPSQLSDWAWSPLLDDGEAILGPALSSGPDLYTATYEVGDVSVGATGTEISGQDLTRTADGSEAATITVQLRDALGVPIPEADVEVTFSTTLGTLSSTDPVLTNAAGIATVTLTSTVAGEAQVTATVEVASVPQAITNGSPVAVTFEAGPPAGITLAAPGPVVAGDASDDFLLTVEDATGNTTTVTDATTFTLTSTSGGTVTFSGATVSSGVVTVLAGQSSATFTYVDTETGIQTVTATWDAENDGASLGTAEDDIEVISGAVSAGTSTVAADPEEVLADGVSTSTITVTVRNAFSVPVAGVAVLLSQGGTSTISDDGEGVTDASGVVTFTVSSATVQEVTYTATADPDDANVVITQDAAVDFVTAGPHAGNSTLGRTPDTVLANGVSSSLLTVTVRNGADEPVLGLEDEDFLFGALSGATVDGFTDIGLGVYTFTVTTTTPATDVEITVTVDGVALGTFDVIDFVAAVPSGATSTLGALPASVLANGVGASTLTVTVKDADGEPIEGLEEEAFDFTDLGDADVGGFVEVGGGVYTLTLTNTTVQTVTASVAVSTVDLGLFPPVAFTTPAPDAGASDLDAAPTSVLANGVSTSTLTVTVKDADGEPIEGLVAGDFDFTDLGDADVGGLVEVGGGVYTFTLTNTTAEVVTAGVTVSGVDLGLFPAVTFTVPAPDAGASDLDAAPTSVLANGVSVSTLTVTVNDADGEPILSLLEGAFVFRDLGDAEVDGFIEVGGGVYTFALTNTTAEAVTPGVTASGVDLGTFATVTFTAQAPDADESMLLPLPTSVLANGVSASTLTITVNDAAGEPITGLLAGAFVFRDLEDAEVDGFIEVGGGVYTFALTNTTAEVVTAGVTVSGVDLGLFPAVTFTAPAPDAGASDLDAAPASVLANGVSVSTLTVTVKDADGEPISGLAEGAFVFRDLGDAEVDAFTEVGGGVYTFALTNNTAEAVTPGVTVGAVDLGLFATVTFTAQAPDAGESDLAAAPTSVLANGVSVSTLTVTVKDAAGEPIEGLEEEDFDFTDLGAATVANFADAGSGVYTFTLTNTTVQTVTASVAVSTVDLGAFPPVTFTAQAPDAGESDLDVAPISVLANGVSASTLTITVNDAAGEPITGLLAGAFVFRDLEDAEVDGFIEVGGGVYTFALTNTTAEVVTAGVTVSGVDLGLFPAVTFTAPAPDAGASDLDAAPASVLANGVSVSTLTVTVKDADGEPIEGLVAGDFDFTDLGGATVANFADTGSGVYTFTLTNTTVQTVTASVAVLTVDLGLFPAVTFTAPAPDAGESDLAAAPTTVLANGVSASTLTITVKDAAGEPITGLVAGAFVFRDLGNAEVDDFAEVGGGVYTFALTNTTAEDVTVGVTVSGVDLGTFATVTFEVVPEAPTYVGPAELEIVGDPIVGEELSVDTDAGDWTGEPAPTLATGWYRCDVASAYLADPAHVDSDCVLVGSDPTYEVAGGDVGSVIVAVVTATNGEGSAAKVSEPTAVVVAPPDDLEVTTTVLPGGVVETGYRQVLAATGGEPPYTWTITAGALPDGLTLDPATGEIAGTPTAEDVFLFTVEVTDDDGEVASQPLSISITAAPVALGVTTTVLPSGMLGTGYSRTLVAAGGTAPYTWAIAAGALPTGLTLDPATGAITGMPTAEGIFSFTVEVTDDDGDVASLALSIGIAPPFEEEPTPQPPAQFEVSPPGPSGVPGAQSGTSNNGRIRVDVPEGAVSEPTVFTIIDILQVRDEVEAVPAGTFLFNGDYIGQVLAELDADGRPITEFAEPIQVTFIIEAAHLDELRNGGEFIITYWNGSEWIALPTVVDLASGEVTAFTNHLTLFALLRGQVEFTQAPYPRGLTLLGLSRVGAEPAAIEIALTREGCDVRSIWAYPGGQPRGYIFGAPAWVNHEFPRALELGAGLVSVCGAAPVVERPPVTPPSPPTEGTPTPTPGPVTVRVVDGDSLFSIAARFGFAWRELAELNGVQGPAFIIYPGQILRLPPGPGSA